MDTISNLKTLKNIREKSRRKPRKYTIVTLYSPYQDIYYEYDGRRIKIVPAPNKKSEIISFISTDEFITETIEISPLVKPSEIDATIEIKAFSELSLEPSIEHKIRSQKTGKTSDGNIEYDIYVAPIPAVEKIAANLKARYIDHLFAPQSVYRSLFARGYLSLDTYAFVYLHMDFAYLCVYQNGFLVYSKPLRASVDTLLKRYCEILGDRVDARRFGDMLLDKAAMTEREQESLRRLLSEFFGQLLDVLSHAKRVGKTGEFKAVYIGSEIGSLRGATKRAAEFFETPFLDFEFDLGLKREDAVDMSVRLMIFAYLNDKKEYEGLNLTIFERPPFFLKRRAGIFLTVCAASFALSFSPIFYNLFLANIINERLTLSANKELDALLPKANELTYALSSQKEANSAVNLEIQKEEKKRQETIETLTKLKNARDGGFATEKIVLLSKAALARDVILQSVSMGQAKDDKNKGEKRIKLACDSIAPSSITDFVKLYENTSKDKLQTIYISQEKGRYVGSIAFKGEGR